MKDAANAPKSDRVPPIAELAPADYCDLVVEAYKKDVDRTLLRENLKLTVEERIIQFERFSEFAKELHEAGRRARAAK